MAVVQYTFTHTHTHTHTHAHTQYTERHKTNNTQNNTKILEEYGPWPVFACFILALALQLRKKARENLSQGSRRVPAGTMKIHNTQ